MVAFQILTLETVCLIQLNGDIALNKYQGTVIPTRKAMHGSSLNGKWNYLGILANDGFHSCVMKVTNRISRFNLLVNEGNI